MTTRIVNEVTINGPLDDVFDLVTTARYWTEWHPATVGVSGVVDRPIASGAVIRERAQIASTSMKATGSWPSIFDRRGCCWSAKPGACRSSTHSAPPSWSS
jgi:hypothetical protein